jgi:hypothetical protein
VGCGVEVKKNAVGKSLAFIEVELSEAKTLVYSPSPLQTFFEDRELGPRELTILKTAAYVVSR